MSKTLMFSLLVLILIFGSFLNTSIDGSANAQNGPSTQSSSDALWHLPKFGEQGWFIHAHNGKVRVCNMNNASVIGERQGPRCSSWE